VPTRSLEATPNRVVIHLEGSKVGIPNQGVVIHSREDTLSLEVDTHNQEAVIPNQELVILSQLVVAIRLREDIRHRLQAIRLQVVPAKRDVNFTSPV